METYNQNLKYEQAKERVGELRKFYRSLLIFGIFFLICYGDDFIFDFHFGRISIIFLIWGIILASKAIRLFVFNTDWEKREIQKQLKS